MSFSQIFGFHNPSTRRSSVCRYQFDRSGTTFFGSDARNNTIQTQRRTTSLYKNSPVRFHAIGSVDRLHLTTPGVEKKNDQVIANVPIPINEPRADRIGINAPAVRRAAVVNSTTPRRYASPLIPKMDSHQTNGLLEMYTAMPFADSGVNFCMPNEIKIRIITHRRMPSSRYEPQPFSETLKSLIMMPRVLVRDRAGAEVLSR
jgi:hypothetical protein